MRPSLNCLSFDQEPYSTESIKKSKRITSKAAATHRDTWMKLGESINGVRDPQKAWKKLRSMSSGRTSCKMTTEITPDKVAFQLFSNGKMKRQGMPKELVPLFRTLLFDRAENHKG